MHALYLFAAIVALSGVSAHPTVDLTRRSPTGYSVWPPPSPTPLPVETDGVLQDGTVINKTPDNPSNPNSCWTAPSGDPVNDQSDMYAGGNCQICVTQSGIGPVAEYEAWVRDASNAAMGGIPATKIGVGSSVGNSFTFTTGGEPFTMNIIPNQNSVYASAVQMQWAYPSAPQMYYDPAGSEGSTGQGSRFCAFSGNAQLGAVNYFQCSFTCGPDAWSANG